MEVEETAVELIRLRLAELERDERIISAKRRRLHERIDFLAAEKFGVHMANRLERLYQDEKTLSEQRRELHEQIDRIRADAGLPHYKEELRKTNGGQDLPPELRPTCLLLRLVDGNLRSFDFQDENLAARWHERCLQEWRAERTIVVSMRPGAGQGSGLYTFPARGVHSLEITSRHDALRQGAKCISAVIRLR